MKQKIKKGMCIGCLLLAGCMHVSKTTSTKISDTSQEGVQVTKAKKQDYRMLFLDSKYPTSQTRGATITLGLSSNITAFEIGLMELSKKYFSPNDYYFLEGHYVTGEEINKWLGNSSQDNPLGLNDTKTGEEDFIVTIVEQDYMTYENNNYMLSGVSIGIALNPYISSSKTLSDAELLSRGKLSAEKVVAFLRQKEGFQSIPIHVGLFKQNNDNGVARGSYLVSGITQQVSISNWQDTKIEKRIFPLDTDKTEQVTTFSTFKRTIEAFFPNLNGLSAEATFTEDVLTKLQVTITTQFYGQAEMKALEQFLIEQANGTYNSEIEMTIHVESVRGTEMVVFKKAADSTFTAVNLK